MSEAQTTLLRNSIAAALEAVGKEKEQTIHLQNIRIDGLCCFCAEKLFERLQPFASLLERKP
jgi:hypothetical protein